MEKFAFSRGQVEAYIERNFEIDWKKGNRIYFKNGGFAEFGNDECECGETEACRIYDDENGDHIADLITICGTCYRENPFSRIEGEGCQTMYEEVLYEVTDGVFATNGEPQNIYDNAADFREMIENEVRDLQAFTPDEVDADDWEDWKAKLDLADAKQVRKIYRAFLSDSGSPVLFASDSDYSF